MNNVILNYINIKVNAMNLNQQIPFVLHLKYVLNALMDVALAQIQIYKIHTNAYLVYKIIIIFKEIAL